MAETYYRNRGMDINTSDLYEKAPDFASTYKSGSKPTSQRPASAPGDAKQASDGKWYTQDPQTKKYTRWD